MDRKEILLAFTALVVITIFFFYKTFIFGLIPFPADLLIAEYNPWKTYSYEGFNPGSFPNKAQYFDTIRQIYPWRFFASDQVREGVLPLWNPYNFSGAPLLANIQSSVLYPLNSLYLLLPTAFAWTVLIILQPLLAGFSTYLFARTIGIGKIGSFISAIAFSYSLFMSVFLEYNTIGHVIAFLPLSLYFLEKLLERKTFLRATLFSTSIAFTFLAGHLQMAAFSLTFILIYLLFRTKKIHLLAPLFLLIVFGIGAAAVQLFPTFELVSLSARVPQDYKFLIEKLLLQPQQLILLFSPDFFGNPATRNYLISDTYPGNAVYIGLIPLLFALLALVQFKNLSIRFFALFSIVLLLLLTRSPITEFLYRFEIPLFSTGSPTNAIFLLSFALSILSGFGVDLWLKNSKDYRVIGLIIGLFVFVWGILLLARPESVSVRNFFYSTGILVIFLGLFVIGERFIKKKLLVACLLLLVTVFDLFYFFHKFNPFVPRELFFPQADIFTWLSKNGGINRFWGYGTASVEANFTTAYKLYSADGYDPLYPKRYGEFIQSSKDGKIATEFTNQTRSDAIVVHGFGETDLVSNPHRLKVLDLLGVKFVLDRVENGSTEKTFPSARFILVYKENGWRIFENKKALPRFFLVSDYKVFRTKEEFEQIFFSGEFDPSRTVLLEEEPGSRFNDFPPEADQSLTENHLSRVSLLTHTANEIRFETETKSDQLLFLSDTHYPGWKAFVDGIETKIYRADYAFRAVLVPNGKHEIRFKYEPESFSLGMKTTIISVALVMFFSFYLGRKKHA